jgi:hypothetical protein
LPTRKPTVPRYDALAFGLLGSRGMLKAAKNVEYSRLAAATVCTTWLSGRVSSVDMVLSSFRRKSIPQHVLVGSHCQATVLVPYEEALISFETTSPTCMYQFLKGLL